MEIVDVALLPGLGRPATDFLPIVGPLQAAGFRCHLLEPPDTFPGEPTLLDLADEVALRLQAAGARYHLVGHAFGNRLARAIVARRNELVASLTLLGAGGYVAMAQDVLESLAACYRPDVSEDDLRQSVRRCMLAPGSDVGPYLTGWMGAVSNYQHDALNRTPAESWVHASCAHTLVVQGLQDVIAVPENGRAYVRDNPRAMLVEIDGAGHALVCEQPNAVSTALLEFFRSTS
jgi:pimeloyl-ACP methyl ester carboxylesterase